MAARHKFYKGRGYMTPEILEEDSSEHEETPVIDSSLNRGM